MVHRALLGSFERFLGVLIEHYAGAFPTWLAPTQAILLTITDASASYAEILLKRLKAEGIRASWDSRNEKLGLKIRQAQLEKIPYMAVIGDREMAQNKIAVRSRIEGDLGPMTIEEFIHKLKA